MKTKTVTREYDADGKMTRKTTTVTETTPGCSCAWLTYNGGTCPVHGYIPWRQPITWTSTVPFNPNPTYTVSTNFISSASPTEAKAVADDVTRKLSTY